MALSSLVAFFLVFRLSAAATTSQNTPGAGGPACVQKLLPCQPYLHAAAPPATCCLPLKELLAGDVQCLCAIFNNESLLRAFNVTKDQALQLPKACGASANLSLCGKSGGGGEVGSGTPNASAPGSAKPSPISVPPAQVSTPSSASARSNDLTTATVATIVVGLIQAAAAAFV